MRTSKKQVFELGNHEEGLGKIFPRTWVSSFSMLYLW